MSTSTQVWSRKEAIPPEQAAKPREQEKKLEEMPIENFRKMNPRSLKKLFARAY